MTKSKNKIKITEKKLKALRENAKKGGKPAIPVNFTSIERQIDIQQVIYWIGLQATCEEIAGSFRVCAKTLDNKLKETFGVGFQELKKRLGDGAEGKLSLRRHQFRLAETNASMAIWLGKQWLDQKDTIHQNTTIEEGSSIKIYLPDNGRG